MQHNCIVCFMFGYVGIYKPELKFKEFDTYRAYYCGLCQSLKKQHGICGQLTLSYDMTFLVILLSSLYEPSTTKSSCRCIAHPTKQQFTSHNIYSDYVADMNIILSYYKCLDDWQDEKKLSSLIFSKLLKSGAFINESPNETFINYPDKTKVIIDNLKLLEKYEAEHISDIDMVAGTFGNIMACLFSPHHDQWEPYLSHIGFFLGKFIYILDAYDDIEKDIKDNSYNPFSSIYKQKDFSDKIMSMLKMMMSEAAGAFEMLPIIDNIEILRNILYAGVWQNSALHKERNFE